MNSALESFQTQLDNPGYMDFNNPTPAPYNKAQNNSRDNTSNASGFPAAVSNQKKKNLKLKQKNKNQPQQHQQRRPPGGVHTTNGDSNINWHKNNKNFNGVDTGQHRKFANVRGFPGRRPIPPPMPPSNKRMGPMHRMPPLPNAGHGFQPQPPMPLVPSQLMNPPIPRMRRGGGIGPNQPLPPPIPPPYFRRNMPARPPPVPPFPMQMQSPHMPRPFVRAGMPPYHVAGIDSMKSKLQRKPLKDKGSSTIKTLKNLVNQYPLDKPWVNDQIRSEHEKKIDLENRLKGNKDDDLFGQFKIQRDKFVAMYESGREEYLKQEAAAVKANTTATA